MDGSFRIGRIFGIPILIHYTFILVIPLFAWIIGSEITNNIQAITSTKLCSGWKRA